MIAAVMLFCRRAWYVLFWIVKNDKQAGAELGQAQLKLELDFTFIRMNWWLLSAINQYISLNMISLYKELPAFSSTTPYQPCHTNPFFFLK